MDRQRATVIGVAAAVVALVLIGVGVIVGRASAGQSTDPGPADSATSEGLPDGPTGIEDGVPVGFAHSEEGVVAAAAAWVPPLISTPASERPDGIESVLADGVESPVGEGLSIRIQFVPWAARVSMSSEDEAVVTLLGTGLTGEVDDELDGGMLPLESTLVWDDDAGSWQVSAIDMTADFLEPPIRPEDVSGFQVLRFYGGTRAGVVMEEVPGD
jgi:hypothetical protein